MKLKQDVILLVFLSMVTLVVTPIPFSFAQEENSPKSIEGKDKVGSGRGVASNSGTAKDTIRDFYERKLLKGTVELSSELPPISANLLPGNKYPDEPIGDRERIENWIKLPEWSVGYWRSQMTAKISGIDETVDRSFHRGTIRDAEGNFWELRRVPYSTSEQGFQQLKDKNVVDYEDSYADKRTVINRSHYLASKVDNNGLILSSWQEEVTTEVSPLRKGHIKCVYKVRRYDIHGISLGESEEVREIYRKAKEFESSTDDVAKEKFKNYLIAHGLQRLIPKD